MSILIKGMKMPKRCEDCPLCHYMESGTIVACGCRATLMIRHMSESCRPDWCPLIEIPPHGDLIDMDAEVDVTIYEEHDTYIKTMTVAECLDYAGAERPGVVIEAEVDDA